MKFTLHPGSYDWQFLPIVGSTFTDSGTQVVHGPPGGPAADYYVDNTNGSCSDGGPGSLAVPFCTIGHAAGLVSAGQTVRVVAGTYAETVNGPNSGTAGNPITYSAAPGVTVTGNGTASGNAFRMTSKSYIVIDGFTITNTVDYGIYASGSNHITISNNHVSSAGSPGLGLDADGHLLHQHRRLDDHRQHHRSQQPGRYPPDRRLVRQPRQRQRLLSPTPRSGSATRPASR